MVQGSKNEEKNLLRGKKKHRNSLSSKEKRKVLNRKRILYANNSEKMREKQEKHCREKSLKMIKWQRRKESLLILKMKMMKDQ